MTRLRAFGLLAVLLSAPAFAVVLSYTLAENSSTSLVGSIRTTAYPTGNAPSPEVGEYRFTTATSSIGEQATSQTACVERVNGNSGATSVDVTDDETGSLTSATHYDAISDTTFSWATGVDGIAGCLNVTVNDISADGDIDLSFTNAVGGIGAASTLQTHQVSVTAAQASVADLIVSPSGHATEPCTPGVEDGSSSNPYCEPEDALEAATAGDTICLNTHVYVDHDGDNRVIEVASNEGGTVADPITITACDGESPIIGSATYSADAFGIYLIGADNLVFENLHVRGFTYGGFYGGENGTNGSTNITLRGMTFEDNGEGFQDCSDPIGHSAVYWGPYTNGTVMENSTIIRPGRAADTSCDGGASNQYWHDHGVYARGKCHLIRNNVFYDILFGFGIKIDGYRTALGQGGCDYGSGSTNYTMVIVNNTFDENIANHSYTTVAGHPIRPVNTTSDSFNNIYYVANNIFLDPTLTNTRPGGSSVHPNQAASYYGGGHVCNNNMVTGSQAGDVSCYPEYLTQHTGNFSSITNNVATTEAALDFDDAANDDYHIGVSSSAINQGDCTLLGTPSTDKDGNARGSTCDAGAYEYTP